MKGLGFAVDGWAVVFTNEIDGTFSVNCLVKRPGGQPGTSVSPPTLVKSRSWKGKNAEFSVTSLAQPRVWYAMLVAGVVVAVSGRIEALGFEELMMSACAGAGRHYLIGKAVMGVECRCGRRQWRVGDNWQPRWGQVGNRVTTPKGLESLDRIDRVRRREIRNRRITSGQ